MIYRAAICLMLGVVFAACAIGHVEATYPDGRRIELTGAALAHGKIEVVCATTPIPSTTPGTEPTPEQIASIEGGFLSAGAWGVLGQIVMAVGVYFGTH